MAYSNYHPSCQKNMAVYVNYTVFAALNKCWIKKALDAHFSSWKFFNTKSLVHMGKSFFIYLFFFFFLRFIGYAGSSSKLQADFL